LLGTSPIGLDPQTARTEGLTAVAITVAIDLIFTIICLLKGKLNTGLLRLPIPLLALVGAVRLAKPSSFLGPAMVLRAQAGQGARAVRGAIPGPPGAPA
jgi:hypothetical protein